MVPLSRFLSSPLRDLVTLVFLAALVRAQTPRDFAIDLSATPSTHTPCLTLNWSIRRQNNITAQKIHRRLKGAAIWAKLSDLSTNQTSYADDTATTGVEYEYWMERTYTGISPTTAMGYLSAGVDVPMVESRGKLLLVVDSTMAAPLAPEIAQLQADLVGEGWTIQTITALRTDTAANVKAQIVAAYNADPTNLKMVYLLGHVPVPYSGNFNPDGHTDHVGAWPCDGYYGEVDGTWTDTTVNNTSASDARNDNIPGDGKFDQFYFPNLLELIVGRVDLKGMTHAPSSGVSETALLRRYLRKAHDFRMKQGTYADIPRRSLIRDGFGYFSGENFAIAGWAWAFTGAGVQVDEPPSGQWFSESYAGGKTYLVGYGNGGGSYTSASTVGYTEDFGLKPSRAVFTSLFGSYFGDWDRDNNFLRAPLAGNATGNSLGLTCFWGGRPNRFMHPLGMGETAGYAMWVSQNGSLAGGGGYTPNTDARTHTGLMGDPSLRLYAVEPPRNLTAISLNSQVALAWSASTENALLGYHVYRSDNIEGPYTRLTASPLGTESYADGTVSIGQTYCYMVRTLKCESTPGGTFDNLSVGIPISVTVSTAALAVPGAPGTPTVAQSCSTSALLTWVDTSAGETGFRIERQVNAGGSFSPIGTVAANVTNFTDTGVFTHGNVYYYRIVATGTAGDSAPSAVISFDAVAGFFDMPVTRMKVNKTDGTATVTVNRFGGVTGAVSVHYATSDTSAFAGTHYVNVSGTLTWDDGDTSPRTINVPLINSATPHAARQFKVTLSGLSVGTTLTVNTYCTVLIEDPTATLDAPWSQTTIGGLTDKSSAVTEAGSLCSVTLGGAGLTGTSTSESGQFIYQSRSGDGVLTAYFPTGLPSDGNARYAVMVRASTANNAVMAATVASTTTGFGTRFFSRSSTGSSSSLLPASANTFVLARWLRISRAGNVFSAETSTDGVEWKTLGSTTLPNMPATASWGIFHTSSDWSVTALGNYHLAQAQTVTLTGLPTPEKPSGLVAVSATTTSVALRWNNASFASGYRIERRTEGGAFSMINQMASVSGTNQLYTNTGLDMNTAYAYRIVATNAVGESSPSDPAYVATSFESPITITTDNAGGADATIQRDQGDTPLGTLTNLDVSYCEPNTYMMLTNATKTYLRFNLAGLGLISSATLKLALLGVREYEGFGYTQQNVGLLGESSDTWEENGITWSNAPQNSLSGYGFLSPVVSLGTSYNFANDTTAPGTLIPFTLSAANLNANRGANQLVTMVVYESYSAHVGWAAREHPVFSPPSLELIVITNVPNRAAFLTTAAGTGWSVDLHWLDTSTNETGFTLERRVEAGAFEGLQTFGANVTTYHDTDTQPGVTYTYRVRSFNAYGPSDWTPEVSIVAATPENALSTVWDGGGSDSLWTTATNWDFNTVPPLDGSVTLTFGMGGSLATVNTTAALYGLVFNRDADFTLGEGGDTLTLGAGGLRALLPTAVSRSYTLGAELILISNQSWAVTNNGAGVATVTVAGSVSDGGSGARLTKCGNGVLTLTGDNSYSGLTTVQTGGVLRISHAHALGSAASATAVENGGWLELSGGIAVEEPISLTGDAALGYAGTLRSTGGSNVWSGPVTMNGARIKVTSGSLDVIGGVSGSSCVFGANGDTQVRIASQPVDIGTGTFYAHNSGGTIILDVMGNRWGSMDTVNGTIRTDVPNAFPDSSTLQLGTGTTIDLNGHSQTVGSFKNSNANIGLRLVTSATPATLTVSQEATTYYDGILSGALGLTKNGIGMLTLSNALNTLTGPVTVNEGTLTVAPDTRLGNTPSVKVTGGTLQLRSTNALPDTATVRIEAGGAKLHIDSGIVTVAALYLGGQHQSRGTYGSSTSHAGHKDDTYFYPSATGILNVLHGPACVILVK